MYVIRFNGIACVAESGGVGQPRHILAAQAGVDLA